MAYFRTFAFVILTGLAGSALGHGPTTCVGTLTLTSNSAILDLRVGVGLLHQYVDPDNNSVVTPAEWDHTSETLHTITRARITMGWDQQPLVTARNINMSLTSGAEVQTVAEFDLSSAPKSVYLAAPFVMNLEGAPPAMLSVIDANQRILRPAQYVYFDKPMAIDRP